MFGLGIIAILSSLLIPFCLLYADEAERSEQGLILRGSNCKDLKEDQSALISWSKKIGESPQEAGECQCEPTTSEYNEKACRIEITDAVPLRVKELVGTFAAKNGPNCWNAAIVSAKMLPNLRYSSHEEMTFWMSSPLCKERQPGEHPQPGDVVAIRTLESDVAGFHTNADEEIHGFIYVNERLGFEKGGLEKEGAYSLKGFNDILNHYGTACDTFFHPSGAAANCTVKAKYFNCMTIDQYMKIRDFRPSPTFSKIEEEICDLEKSISHSALTGNLMESMTSILGDSDNVINGMIVNSIEVLEKLVKDELGKSQVDEEKFLLNTLILKLDSALEQIEQFSGPELTLVDDSKIEQLSVHCPAEIDEMLKKNKSAGWGEFQKLRNGDITTLYFGPKEYPSAPIPPDETSGKLLLIKHDQSGAELGQNKTRYSCKLHVFPKK